MKLSLNNRSFPISVDDGLRQFLPFNHKSHLWSRNLSQILLERYTQFSRTRTSLKKGRSWKIIVIQLSISSFQQNKSFPCLPRIGRNGNQFNKSFSTVILETINTIRVVSGDNGNTTSTLRGIDA